MPLVEISSISDPRLEVFRNLKDTNRTRWEGLFIAEGEKLVTRLLESEFEVAALLFGQSFLTRWSERLPDHVATLVVPDPWVEQLVGFNFHRGVLACGRRKIRTQLEDVASPGAQRLLLVACPEINDPENLGAIIRTSAAFGVDALLLGSRCCDPFSRRVLRVSMGAALRIPILQPTDALAELQRLQKNWGLEAIAAVLDSDAEHLQSAEASNRLALVFGAEAHGLPQKWVNACDRRVSIPMAPGTDSLNVGTATGIFLYHFAQFQNPKRPTSNRGTRAAEK